MKRSRAMQTWGQRRREADLFFADLVGQPPRQRWSAPREQEAAPGPATSASRGSNFATIFDQVVHRSAESTVNFGEADEAWEVVARPRTAAPLASLRAQDLVLYRALGEGKLATTRVLGEDVHPHQLYGPHGLLRDDVLVLRRAHGAVESDESAAGYGMPYREDSAEAVPRSGRGTFRHDPLGPPPGDNVEARWNVDATTAAGTSIDVVVHLHGYGAPAANFLAQKAVMAGVDMVDASGTVQVRAGRPTLALVPRGRNTSGNSWVFNSVLPDAAAFNALVEAGLAYLATTVLGLPQGSTLPRGRLTVMAHSGGGAGLSHLLSNGLDPDEVVCFDSMYGGEGPIARWAAARIASTNAATSALRAFYTGCGGPSAGHPGGQWVARNGRWVYQQPGSWEYRNGSWRLLSTEVSSRRLKHAIDRALSGVSSGAALTSRFRVERTSVGHSDIPRRYTPLLLQDISANVPGATAAPAASSRPACVANDTWLTQAPVKPGGNDAPPARPEGDPPGEAVGAPGEAGPLATEDVYSAPDARPYTPSTDPALFRVPPVPVGVTPASQWPQAITTGDADVDAATGRALTAVGVTAAGMRALTGDGITGLRPITAMFGEAMLIELLRRLRYTPAQLAAPPHSYDDDAQLAQAFGLRTLPLAKLLAMRVLLAIPGHFRELARQAGTEQEAHALECMGWLLMQSLRGDVVTATGIDFWLPPSPGFVTPFPNALPQFSPQLHRLVMRSGQIDTTLELPAFLGRFNAWRTGAPGRHWRLETGRETLPGRPVGAPFYREVFTIPSSINIASQRSQVSAAWAQRLADFDAGRTTKALTKCDNSYLSSLHLTGPFSLGGLQLRGFFPSPARSRALTTMTGLAVLRPAFEAVFQAAADLGWNDLLFETQGTGCFRGKKIRGRPEAARNMSEHSLAIAIDLNAFENKQPTTGSMDPRIAALFEAFRFRWGKGFSTPDPMHFEYAG